MKLEQIEPKLEPPKHLVWEMSNWGRVLSHLGMAPYLPDKGWAGNIGFRHNDIIWVTATGSNLNRIDIDDVVGFKVEGKKVHYWNDHGKSPTSEWQIYKSIFSKRKDINAVIHAHDQLILQHIDELAKQFEYVGVTRSITESGSTEFCWEINEIINNDYLIARDHGFFSLGRSFDYAGRAALFLHKYSKTLEVNDENYNR